jgi:undecaprenyl-diphosphatase
MELQLWQILILAIVQGLTEFLPISSDGHLAVIAALIAPEYGSENLEVSDLVIVLHGGTLLSIVVFYWQRLLQLFRADRRTIRLLAVATLPTVLVGFPIKIFAEDWLTNPVLAGICLVATGIVLLVAARATHGTREYSQIGYKHAVTIGLAQAAAILPGLSRSGCTIGAALGLQLNPRAAATFSFLMAIPVIAGACLFEFVKVVGQGELQTPILYLIAGVAVSFAVGLVSLFWLVKWLERGRFACFAWWCIPFGAAVLVWQLTLVHPVSESPHRVDRPTQSRPISSQPVQPSALGYHP